jgi:hypothetical protein
MKGGRPPRAHSPAEVANLSEADGRDAARLRTSA